MVKIALDAGHGYNTAGKRCLRSIDPNETREWFLNSRIVEKVMDRLNDYDVEVIRVDDPTGRTDVPLATRCKIANDENVDAYYSFHHNAGVNGGAGGGIVVITYDDSAKSVALRDMLYDSLLDNGGLKGNRSKPKYSNRTLYVLNGTRRIACLVEHGFMDSTTDTPIILTEEYADNMADGWVEFLIAYHDLKKKADVKPQPAPKPYSPIAKPNITYRANTKHGLLPEVTNLEDYAGIIGYPVLGLAIKVDEKNIKYRVHNKGGNWLPYVSGYNINDFVNGWAGSNKEIDAIEVIGDGFTVKYRVSAKGKQYYAWQYNNSKTGGQDGYAGLFGKSIDRVQMIID